MKEKIVSLIIEAAEEMNEYLENKIETKDRGEAKLYGDHGVLDSLGLVNLVVAVESLIEDKFDVELTLADEKAMSQRNSPFLTIDTLSDYIQSILK